MLPCLFGATCAHLQTPPPTSSPLPALGLSSLLSQRHMALQHAAHAIITSHIPWNTSSTLLPPVLPRSQIRPPTPPPPKPSLAAPTFSHTLCHPPPPNPLLISTRLKAPAPREPQATRASHRALSAALTVCQVHWIGLPRPTSATPDHEGKRASGTRT